jgi:pilus assembly protein CpaF
MASLKDQIAGWGQTSPKSNLNEKIPASNKANNKQNSLADENVKVDPYDTFVKKSPLYLARKLKLHQDLISRLDLSSIESMPQDQLISQLKEIVDTLITEAAFAINEKERAEIITDLQNEVLGLGPLEHLLADPTVSEIMVNGHANIYVERKGRLDRSPITFDNDDHLLKIIDKIVSRVGRRIDESSPMVDARLADGSRVNAIIPPLALDGPSLTIRRFSVVPLQMLSLIHI